MTNYINASLRDEVMRRANNCCEYCLSQERFSVQRFSIEHIIPLSKGGSHHLDNLAYACQGCNNHKYNKTQAVDPVNDNIVLLYNPRSQVWTRHFAWNESFELIIGLTPFGRATVDALQLNRSGLVNLRQVLYRMGEHPL
jgi:hypothetical protein